MTDPLEGFWTKKEQCDHDDLCPGDDCDGWRPALDIEALGRLVDAVRVALHKVDHCCGCLNYDEGDALRAALPERSE